MSFSGLQKTFTCVQQNHASPDRVFPLLCPVKEKDWLDGWEYTMIHSVSGIAEENCVFSTPNNGAQDTIWHITRHDKTAFIIEFVRVFPMENVVRIHIRLTENGDQTTSTHISYQYTALNEKQNLFIQNDLEKQFHASMAWWEKSINHYLKTGEKLMKI